MSKHPKEERTFVMIKPDGVKKGLTGEVVRRIEQRGLKLVAIEMMQPTAEQIDNHYPKEDSWIHRLGEKTLTTYEKFGYDPIEELGTDKKEEIGPMVREWLVQYMISAPLVKMVFEGAHAVDVVRKIAGTTMPVDSPIGTIRGDFSSESAALANKDKRAVMNILHCSETPEEAEHEIEHWFAPDQLHSYERAGEV